MMFTFKVDASDIERTRTLLYWISSIKIQIPDTRVRWPFILRHLFDVASAIKSRGAGSRSRIRPPCNR
jgi:hypothetical protein